FAQLPGHAGGGEARGEAAGFQDPALAFFQQARLQQGRRHPRGLARAGIRSEHQVRVPAQALDDSRQQGIDGKGGAHLSSLPHGSDRSRRSRPRRRAAAPASTSRRMDASTGAVMAGMETAGVGGKVGVVMDSSRDAYGDTSVESGNEGAN
ncbi:hypothetical protein OY671_012444, partial [Metschnikowia pulcherrima]